MGLVLRKEKDNDSNIAEAIKSPFVVLRMGKMLYTPIMTRPENWHSAF